MKSDICLIILFLVLSAVVFSCGNREDTEVSKGFDSLKSLSAGDTAVQTGTSQFDETISSFSGKYNAVTDWSGYGKQEKYAFRKNALNKYIVVPVLKEQISEIRESGFTDTTLVFTGNKSNAFVFLVKSGEGKAEKLMPDKNSLLLLKVRDISDSQKLYLLKKSTDFQHRELKVTEFVITADLIDAVNTDASAAALGKKFAAHW
ncbi:MAG: hypothetical protein LWX07_04255 [Bacteroidetes bacterium]|nr:hypothetical protein [Bacteroidota bacterium]